MIERQNSGRGDLACSTLRYWRTLCVPQAREAIFCNERLESFSCKFIEEFARGAVPLGRGRRPRRPPF
jgi:hypothetical protein